MNLHSVSEADFYRQTIRMSNARISRGAGSVRATPCGFGGLERGWAETALRLDWAAAQFAGGSVEEKDLSVIVGADLACTVTIERYDARLRTARATIN